MRQRLDDPMGDALSMREQDGAMHLRLAGRWTLEVARTADHQLRDLAERPARAVVVDASGLAALDSAGAWAIRRTVARLDARGVPSELTGVPERFQAILAKVTLPDPAAEVASTPGNPILAVLENCGRAVEHGARVGRALLGFFGFALVNLAGAFVNPRRLRVAAITAQIEATGVNAIPIVGLLCFLVGIVLAYMGALQLERFGATILTVNLVGVSVLREIGILLTAIIVAGRSGSAFAAQIGTMKVNQEVDALETMGLSTMDVLVLPRMIAMMVALPALTVFGDAMGLLGGAVVALFLLDLSVGQFVAQLVGAVDIWDFGTGLIKAPVFALVIALVGCYDGLKVSGSAESVGRYTTQAVVESIFLVIVLDAGFAVAFAELGI